METLYTQSFEEILRYCAHVRVWYLRLTFARSPLIISQPTQTLPERKDNKVLNLEYQSL